MSSAFAERICVLCDLIDYALNDVGIGLERSEAAWSKMIEKALENQIKVILVTPSPDQWQDITDPENVLAKHAEQIRRLAAKYHVGLADPFAEFQKIARKKVQWRSTCRM